jgi:hypothetical protein
MTGTDDLPDLPNTCRKGAQTPSKIDSRQLLHPPVVTIAKNALEGPKNLILGQEKTERAGFEPAVPARGTPVFETGSISHSDTSPNY